MIEANLKEPDGRNPGRRVNTLKRVVSDEIM